MKKVIYALACAMLLSVTACDDFLEENPQTTVKLEAYYKTEAQATANVNSLYWRGAFHCYADAGSAYTGPKASVNGMLTGYFVNAYEGQEIVCMLARTLTRQSDKPNLAVAVKDTWDPCYEAINIANGAIQYIPKIEMGDALRSQLVGEARFFRARSTISI